MVPLCGTVILADCDTFDGADAMRHGVISMGIPLYEATMEFAEPCAQLSGDCMPVVDTVLTQNVNFPRTFFAGQSME